MFSHSVLKNRRYEGKCQIGHTYYFCMAYLTLTKKLILVSLQRDTLQKTLGLEEVKGDHEYDQLHYLRNKYDGYLFEKAQRERGLVTSGRRYEQYLVILDTETTDIQGEILEIAIIDKKGDVLFDSLVKPKGSISQRAYEIHGISEIC